MDSNVQGRDPKRVFISSTCNDLIDLRAELGESLKEWGFSPLLSEGGDTLFSAKDGSDTLEVCLTQVRTCAAVVVVLSQRYGSIVRAGPFAGKSFTHAEVETARHEGIPLLFYLRDRLHGEYNQWKRQPDTYEPQWTEAPTAYLLFGMIRDHEEVEPERSRWLWTFQNARDLRQRIVRDLDGALPGAVAEVVLSRDTSPRLSVEYDGVGSQDPNSARLNIRNHGTGPALDVHMAILTPRPIMAIGSIGPGSCWAKAVAIPAAYLAWLRGSGNQTPPIGYPKEARGYIEYQTIDGTRVRDALLVTRRGSHGPPVFMTLKRRIVESPKIDTEREEVELGGYMTWNGWLMPQAIT